MQTLQTQGSGCIEPGAQQEGADPGSPPKESAARAGVSFTLSQSSSICPVQTNGQGTFLFVFKQ